MSKFGTLEILPAEDAGMNECEDSGWMKGVLLGVLLLGFKAEGICRERTQGAEALAFQRNFQTMMRGGPLRLVATAGAAVTAGIFTLSMLSSVSLGAFQTVVENKRKKTAPKCGSCKGRGFVECRLCKGDSTIEWSPLYDPVVTKPCVCPTCDGNKVQKCLNCVGRGYV